MPIPSDYRQQYECIKVKFNNYILYYMTDGIDLTVINFKYTGNREPIRCVNNRYYLVAIDASV